MRTLLPLVRREVRDARAHIVASALIAVAVSIAAQYWLFGFREGALVAQVLVPLIGGLFVASLASDLVAADVATKRIEPLAMLPVPATKLWTAKALFLVIAGAGFIEFVALTQLVILSIAGTGTAATTFQESMATTAPQLAAVFAVGAASFFFSTLLERGFAAVVAAVAVLGGIAFTVEWLALPYVSDQTSAALRLALPLVVGAAFTAASALAFVRGGVHRGTKLRPALVGVGAALVLVVPAGTAAAALGTSNPSRDCRDVQVQAAVVSPDGKWAAIETNDASGERVWISEIATGAVRLAVAGFGELPARSAWTVESNLRVIESSFTFRGPRRFSFVTVEPSHLGVVEESAKPWADLAKEDVPSWGVVHREPSKSPDRIVWSVQVYGAPYGANPCRKWEASEVRLGWRQSVTYALAAGTLSRFDLAKGGKTELATGVTSFRESHDGRRVVVQGDGGNRVLDAETGAVLITTTGQLTWVQSPPSRFVVEWDATPSAWGSPRVHDLDSGGAVVLSAPAPASLEGVPAVLTDGGIVTRTACGVHLHGADGSVRRRLFPAGDDRR